MNPITIIAMATGLIKFAVQLRETLIKNKEWTPEQEAAFTKVRQEAYKDDHWQQHGSLKPK